MTLSPMSQTLLTVCLSHYSIHLWLDSLSLDCLFLTGKCLSTHPVRFVDLYKEVRMALSKASISCTWFWRQIKIIDFVTVLLFDIDSFVFFQLVLDSLIFISPKIL